MKNIFRRNKTPQQLGLDAERLLKDPLFAGSIEAVEGIVLDALKTSRIESAADKDRIALLVLRLQSIEGVKRLLDQQISFGRLAAEQELERELEGKPKGYKRA